MSWPIFLIVFGVGIAVVLLVNFGGPLFKWASSLKIGGGKAGPHEMLDCYHMAIAECPPEEQAEFKRIWSLILMKVPSKEPSEVASER